MAGALHDGWLPRWLDKALPVVDTERGEDAGTEQADARHRPDGEAGDPLIGPSSYDLAGPACPMRGAGRLDTPGGAIDGFRASPWRLPGGGWNVPAPS